MGSARIWLAIARNPYQIKYPPSLAHNFPPNYYNFSFWILISFANFNFDRTQISFPLIVFIGHLTAINYTNIFVIFGALHAKLKFKLVYIKSLILAFSLVHLLLFFIFFNILNIDRLRPIIRPCCLLVMAPPHKLRINFLLLFRIWPITLDIIHMNPLVALPL